MARSRITGARLPDGLIDAARAANPELADRTDSETVRAALYIATGLTAAEAVNAGARSRKLERPRVRTQPRTQMAS